MDKEDVKYFFGQLVITFGACLIALYAYDQFNKPKTAAPLTAPATTATA